LFAAAAKYVEGIKVYVGHFSDLPRLDVLSASDPFVVVYTWPLRAAANASWVELGRTETIKYASWSPRAVR
jgi:hypothetical protein